MGPIISKELSLKSLQLCKVSKIKVLARIFHYGHWIHKDLYIKCPEASLSHLLTFPKMILLCRKLLGAKSKFFLLLLKSDTMQ